MQQPAIARTLAGYLLRHSMGIRCAPTSIGLDPGPTDSAGSVVELADPALHPWRSLQIPLWAAAGDTAGAALHMAFHGAPVLGAVRGILPPRNPYLRPPALRPGAAKIPGPTCPPPARWWRCDGPRPHRTACGAESRTVLARRRAGTAAEAISFHLAGCAPGLTRTEVG